MLKGETKIICSNKIYLIKCGKKYRVIFGLTKPVKYVAMLSIPYMTVKEYEVWLQHSKTVTDFIWKYSEMDKELFNIGDKVHVENENGKIKDKGVIVNISLNDFKGIKVKRYLIEDSYHQKVWVNYYEKNWRLIKDDKM